MQRKMASERAATSSAAAAAAVGGGGGGGGVEVRDSPASLRVRGLRSRADDFLARIASEAGERASYVSGENGEDSPPPRVRMRSARKPLADERFAHGVTMQVALKSTSFTSFKQQMQARRADQEYAESELRFQGGAAAEVEAERREAAVDLRYAFETHQPSRSAGEASAPHLAELVAELPQSVERTPERRRRTEASSLLFDRGLDNSSGSDGVAYLSDDYDYGRDTIGGQLDGADDREDTRFFGSASTAAPVVAARPTTTTSDNEASEDDDGGQTGARSARFGCSYCAASGMSRCSRCSDMSRDDFATYKVAVLRELST